MDAAGDNVPVCMWRPDAGRVTNMDRFRQRINENFNENLSKLTSVLAMAVQLLAAWLLSCTYSDTYTHTFTCIWPADDKLNTAMWAVVLHAELI